MNSIIILVGAIIVFLLAYKIYGRFLNRTYEINEKNKTPAHAKYDGVDYVPAKNWFVLFGHHFSSICGAGPIVGPVLAVAYWGWAPSFVWILFGAVLMGAVADYSSLVLSMRSGGNSIAEIAKPEISSRARFLFSWFIWVAVILVIAVFAIFGAKTLTQDPEAVVPATGLIPIAVLTGWFIYRTKLGTLWGTVIGLGLVASLLFLGHMFPVTTPSFSWISGNNIWILILLAYCIVASVTPVNILLQPRDYLASYLLIFTIVLGAVSIFVNHPQMSTAAFHSWSPTSVWPNSGPVFPMLFVTIACGAISGFHSLVSSGTTCKQIANETHACKIGYGGMLTEGIVAVLVLICVGAAMSQTELTDILMKGGPISAFGEGYGRLTFFVLGDYGEAFAILALNTFILTTLDSATRIARYLTMDLFKLKNKYLATLIVVIAAGSLALTGHWTLIWPAFGTSNQLIAGLALLVASCWLMRRGRRSLMTLIPAILMLIVTTCAFVYQIYQSLTVLSADDAPDYFIAAVSGVLIVLSLIVFWESLSVLRKKNLSSAN